MVFGTPSSSQEVFKVVGRPTIEKNILERFFQKLETEQRIPSNIIQRLRSLAEAGQMKDVNALLASFEEGLTEHAKNKTS